LRGVELFPAALGAARQSAHFDKTDQPFRRIPLPHSFTRSDSRAEIRGDNCEAFAKRKQRHENESRALHRVEYG